MAGEQVRKEQGAFHEPQRWLDKDLTPALPMNRRLGRDIHVASTYYGTGTCHAEAA